MAEQAETTQKKYPFDEEDIKYEKEIADAIKKLPIDQRFQAIALNNYILMRKQLDVEVEGQIQEIVKKYNKLQAPLMQALNEIISGKRAPTEEEFQAVKGHLNDEELSKLPENVNSEPIADYWFKVLTACAKLKEDIFETDHPLLKAITQIEQIPEDEGENFTIRFHFAPNDYFENDQLSVRFVMVDENDVAKTEGTEIKWKEGKDITKKTVTKKQKNKKTGKTRTVTKTVDADSFFNFFKTIDPKDEEGDDEEGGDDEDVQRLGINYDIAATLQEEIISYHLEYYLGLRTGDEDDDEEGLGGIDEEDDEDDDDDEDEEEGGHKHSKKCAHGHGHGHGKAKGGDKKEGDAAGQKQDCKQQ